MKIAIAQINSRLADIEYNKEQILKHLNSLSSQEADIILFPEFAISGAPLYDAIHSADFVDRCYSALEEIALNFSDCPLLIGMPTQGGDDTFSSIVLIEKGAIKSVFSKAMIDSRLEKNYLAGIDSPDFNDEGDDEIESEIPMNIVTINSRRFLVVIGSDLDYLEQLDKGLNIDGIFSFASPLYSEDGIEEEFEVLAEAAETFKKPLYRISTVGASGISYINFGGSSVTDSKGNLISAVPIFKDGSIVVESGKGGIKSTTPLSGKILARKAMADNFEALCTAVSSYSNSSTTKKCVVVVDKTVASGVVASIAAKSLGSENVLAIVVADDNNEEQGATKIADSLAIEVIKTINKNDINATIKHLSETLAISEIEDSYIINLITKTIAKNNNAFIIGNISKSDFALGNFTKDDISTPTMLLLADMTRSQIAVLANYINGKKELFSPKILTQYTSEQVIKGETKATYSECDKILKLLIQEGLSILEISGKKHHVDVVTMVSKMIAASEQGRFVAAPIVKMSLDTFGIDRIMPLAAKI